MKDYEIVYIIHPDLEGSIEKITERIKKVVEDHQGEVLKEENWGKKKLAYPIKKNSVGIYQFLTARMESIRIKDVERILKLLEEIIRFIIVAQEEAKESPRREKPRTSQGSRPIRKKEGAEKPQKKTEESKEESAERLIELDKKLKEIIGDETSEEEK